MNRREEVMKKYSVVAVVGIALVASASHAQPPNEYKFIPSSQQKLVPDKSGFYAQTVLSRPASGLAMITSRDKSGEAEAHANWADHIFVQKGGATMILGGTIEQPREVGPGETRGSGVSGGKSFAMHPGDYVYVPVNIAHRMVLSPGQSIRYAVVKARP
jgi:mannose-6-phosphate isomerase-like protein (cupin superfamily)